MAEKDSLDKLLVYQQELQSEEECLKKIISQFNDQVHGLQVEQLHILNAINKNSSDKITSNQASSTQPVNHTNTKTEMVNLVEQELDLTIPNFQSSEEDEDEFDFED